MWSPHSNSREITCFQSNKLVVNHDSSLSAEADPSISREYHNGKPIVVLPVGLPLY